MTSLLLDTNALIWLASGVQIGKGTKAIITKAEVVYVSSLSIFELRIKQSNKKLLAAEKVIASIKEMRLSILPLTSNHLTNYKIYSTNNRDPFDNALISTAIDEHLTLVTADRDILSLNHSGFVCINARK